MDSAQTRVADLRLQITNSQVPQEVKDKLDNLLDFPGPPIGTGAEFEKNISYIEFVLSLPFNKFSDDILDIARAKQLLDHNHYGLQVVKDRVLEYLSVLILNKKNPSAATEPWHAPILLFVGLVGTGKTTIAYSIAEALGRKIVRVPFGGLGDPIQLRGESRVKPDAEPGSIVKEIKAAGFSNPVILLDEIDRVAEEGRVNIMGVLVELLDPAQNQAFVDHYLDFPYDLSKVLFIATANNTTNIATAVMDRLEPIQMPSYSDEEKIVIGRQYLLPKAVKLSGIDAKNLIIDDNVWPQIIRPLGYDGGIRSLDRTIQALARKVALRTVQGDPGPFRVTLENLGEYIQI